MEFHAEKRFPSDQEVTRILLQYGANPNEAFNNRTCWENGLTFLWAISNGRDDLDSDFILRRLESVKRLVQADASLLVLQTADGELSPQTIVEGIVDKWCPLEMERVKKTFESKTGGWNYWRNLVGWVTWGQSDHSTPRRGATGNVPCKQRHATGLGLQRIPR